MKISMRCLLAVPLLLVATMVTVPVQAEEPNGCNANLLSLFVDKDKLSVIAGDTVNFTVSIQNLTSIGPSVGCDTDGVDVEFFCPALDGTPTGPSTILTTGAAYGANPPDGETFPPVPCVIPDVGVASVEVVASGNLRDLPDDAASSPFSLSKDLGVEVQTCAVLINKEVSCDGGTTWFDMNGLVTSNEDGTNAPCSAFYGEDILVRYQVRNDGTSGLFACEFNESNPLINGDGAIDGNIPAGTTIGPVDAAPVVQCSEDLEDGEPNTASVNCFCTDDLNPDFMASAFDSADFECEPQLPTIGINKECVDEDPTDGSNEITVTLTATEGDLDIECDVTDEIYLDDPDCPADVGAGTPIALSPTNPVLVPAGSSVDLTAVIAPLSADACNTATADCFIVNPDGADILLAPVSDDAVCPGTGEGCLTRTPGFWGTHPHVTELFLPLDNCGITIGEVEGGLPGSATEDMCSVGRDPKTNSTSNQQVQLVRQCMAAELNIAASADGDGNCFSQDPSLAALMAECCEDLCTSGANGSTISGSTCIERLDAFNNSVDTLDSYGPFLSPGPADPTYCKDSKNNGFLNPGRNYGPKK